MNYEKTMNIVRRRKKKSHEKFYTFNVQKKRNIDFRRKSCVVYVLYTK